MASITYILQRQLFVNCTTREGRCYPKYLEKGTAICLDERTEDGLIYHRLTFTDFSRDSLIPVVAHARKEDIDRALTPLLSEIKLGRYHVLESFIAQKGWVTAGQEVTVISTTTNCPEDDYWYVTIAHGIESNNCDYKTFLKYTRYITAFEKQTVRQGFKDSLRQEYENTLIEAQQKLIDQEKDSLRAARNRLIEELHRLAPIQEVVKTQPKKYEGQYHGPIAHSSMQNPQMGPGYKQLEVGYDDPTGDDFLVGVN